MTWPGLVNQSVSQSVCLSSHTLSLSMCLPACLSSSCLSACLFICLAVHLSMCTRGPLPTREAIQEGIVEVFWSGSLGNNATA